MKPPGKNASEGPMTLQAVMRESIGMGLRERYKPQEEIPHGLLVLLMQMKHDRTRAEQLRLETGG